MRPENIRKSNRRSRNVKKIVDLGDEDTTSDSNNDLASDFESPEVDQSATDYGLEFTNSNIGRPLLSENQQRRLSLESGKPSHEAHVEQHSVGTMQKTQLNQNKELTTKGVSSKADMEHQRKQQQKPRKQKNPKPRDQIFWKDVKRLQAKKSKMIPRLPFARLIQEILVNTSVYATRITGTALEALQESSEMYLTQIIQDAYTLTLHRGRITLDVRDMELLRYFRGKHI